MTIVYLKKSLRKKWKLFIQKIIHKEKKYSIKYSLKELDNFSLKEIIHFFEKLIIAQGYMSLKTVTYRWGGAAGGGGRRRWWCCRRVLQASRLAASRAWRPGPRWRWRLMSQLNCGL